MIEDHNRRYHKVEVVQQCLDKFNIDISQFFSQALYEQIAKELGMSWRTVKFYIRLMKMHCPKKDIETPCGFLKYLKEWDFYVRSPHFERKFYKEFRERFQGKNEHTIYIGTPTPMVFDDFGLIHDYDYQIARLIHEHSESMEIVIGSYKRPERASEKMRFFKSLIREPTITMPITPETFYVYIKRRYKELHKNLTVVLKMSGETARYHEMVERLASEGIRVRFINMAYSYPTVEYFEKDFTEDLEKMV